MNKGSEWKKWDLHVHTPYSYLNNQFGDNFDEYVKKLFLEAIKNKISVIGITDYFSIDGYKAIKNDYLENNKKLKELFSTEEIDKVKDIKLLPNIEFRLNKIIGTNRINFHVIFSDEVEINDIEENFLHDLEFVYEGTPQGSDEKWKLKKTNIVELGKKLILEQPELGDNELFVGLKCAVVDDTQILEILNNKQSKFRDKYLVIVPSDEDLSNINWRSQDHNVRKVIIQKADLLFASNPNTIKWGLGEFNASRQEFINEFKSAKMCIWGSDAHDFKNLFKPSQNRLTWIKANPTFEGLKQITYESSRVYIGKNKPLSPIHKLHSLKFDFPVDLTWKGDKFCFSGITNIEFSPYLTCIIGGRGSGKSTLLNLIANKLGKDENFLSELPLEPHNIVLNPEAIENIEFLAQNHIDKFAKNSKKFTEAIFIRLDKSSNKQLSRFEDDNHQRLEAFSRQITNLTTRQELHQKLAEEKQNLKAYTEIISTFNDKEYLDNKALLDVVVAKISTIIRSRERYRELFVKIKEIDEVFKKEDVENNDYDKFYNELLSTLVDTYEIFKNKDYELIKKTLEGLEAEKTKYSQNIERFLTAKGFSEESVRDLSVAPENISRSKVAINDIKKEIYILKKHISDFDISDGNDEFRQLVEEELSKVNSAFQAIKEKNPDDVKLIEINYKINPDVEDQIFNKLINSLDIEENIRSVRSTFRDYLFKLPVADVMSLKTYQEFEKELEKLSNTTSKTYSILKDTMFNRLNFNIYKLLIQQTQYDFKTNKILEVLYDEKTLDRASFGQRCTAAIVILLSLGNNPIIIDEPEAHLDSSLIANYLVELIKEKKQQRQIIFSTHNANFVLNGDAELVIKLENNDGRTRITTFSIEDLEHRDDLLKLEGGKEAFKKREQKYNLTGK